MYISRYLLINIARSFRLLTGLALFFVFQHSSVAQQLINQLKDSPSPYLAMHGEDPVAWQEWSPATLALARRENKLLFVSIGYFSCHWCHVMQAESYKNAEIAALINRNFIPVKVDRELEVALDAEMIAFAQDTLGIAGWPLNVFITPEGYPLYATLYEKPERFGVILSSIGKEWQADSAGLKALAIKSVKTDQTQEKVKLSAALAEKYRKQLVQETLAQADLLSGGLNVPRKFPLSPQLSALLEIEAREHDARLAGWLRLTLDQMSSGGLRDRIAGGFFRYTIDPLWQRPHFEKMLYDNAQLAMIYLRAAQIFKQPAYRDIAIETLDFMLSEMRAGAGFIASISAVDGRGKEGGNYLWTEEQLKSILDFDDYQLVTKIWGISSSPEFEFGNLPMNRNEPSPDEKRRLNEIYPRLLQVRKQRQSPKDIKVLAGLNGLALTAFSEAAGLDPRYRQAANELRHFIVEEMWQNNVLHKGVSNQQLLEQGDLETYAYVASGLTRYAQLSGKESDKNAALQICKMAWQKFYTPHGFVLEQKSELASPYYQSVIEDGPLPSTSSLLITASLQLGDKSLLVKATNALADVGDLQKRGLFWFAGQVTAINQLYGFKARH